MLLVLAGLGVAGPSVAGHGLADRVLLAHGGGAPEALTIALPLLVIVGFVLAELRVRRRERAADNNRSADSEPET